MEPSRMSTNSPSPRGSEGFSLKSLTWHFTIRLPSVNTHTSGGTYFTWLPMSKYARTHGLWNDSTKFLNRSGWTHRLFHTFSRAMMTLDFSARGMSRLTASFEVSVARFWASMYSLYGALSPTANRDTWPVLSSNSMRNSQGCGILMPPTRHGTRRTASAPNAAAERIAASVWARVDSTLPLSSLLNSAQPRRTEWILMPSLAAHSRHFSASAGFT